MSVNKFSSKFINIKINNGEKSKPPADGIYFLTGESILCEISSTSSRKAFDFSGDIQLKITPPMTANKNILSITNSAVWLQPQSKLSFHIDSKMVPPLKKGI